MFAPISNGWSSRKLKHVARIQSSNVDKKSDPDEIRVRLCNYTDVYYHERLTDSLPLMEATATPEEIRRFELKAGDVLLTKDSETWDDIGVPAYVSEPIDRGVCGYHLAHLRPRVGVIDGAFLARALAARGVSEQFHVSANGITRYGLTLDDMGEARVPTPPVPTQRAIAAFLDRETAKIDALIERKCRLLDLLDEERNAIITRAVTRGLDPDVPMKASRVEWLGEIPAHWEVARLKMLANVLPGYPFPSEKFSLRRGVPLVRIRDLNQSATQVRYDGVPPKEAWIDDGDLLVGMDGEFNAAVWRGGKAVLNQRMACVRAVRIDASFLAYALPFPLRRIEDTKFSTTVKHLSIGEIGGCSVPVPPESVQTTIATYLDEKTGEMEVLASRIRHAISLLREYRISLISAAVTGQIDIKSTAA